MGLCPALVQSLAVDVLFPLLHVKTVLSHLGDVHGRGRVKRNCLCWKTPKITLFEGPFCLGPATGSALSGLMFYHQKYEPNQAPKA